MTDGKTGAFATCNQTDYQQGLTKREYFAALALRGLSAKYYSVHANRGFDDLEISRAMASTAVELADALINELNKEA